jgi:hypothetical protein
VSLVLEALKKLDREKGRDERGFVVMAAAPWPTRAARRWPAWAALGIATAGAVAAALALRTTPAPPVLPAPPAAAVTIRPAASVTATVPATVAPPVPAPARRETREDTAHTKAPAATLAVAPPSPAPRPAEPELRLQAISERDGQPIAIINDHLVRVGDEVDGLRVLAIRGAEVDVEVRGRRTTLRF